MLWRNRWTTTLVAAGVLLLGGFSASIAHEAEESGLDTDAMAERMELDENARDDSTPGGMMERGCCGMMRGGGPAGMRLPDGVVGGELPASESRGARLAARFCSGCHGIPSPGRLGSKAWPDVLERMFGRMAHTSRMSGMRNRMMNRMMGRRGGGTEVANPSSEQRRRLRAYYRQHALAEADEDRLPDRPGRAIFRETCSQCHAVPDPEVRSPQQWPGVLRRMRAHMTRAEDIEPLTDDEAETVLHYLRQASRRGTGADTAAR